MLGYLQAVNAGVNPALSIIYSRIAQSVERWVDNPEVDGSIPSAATLG